jgi:hypothetical protein
MQPLHLFVSIFSLPAPAWHPFLALLVPYFSIAPLRVDALCAGELFPLGRWLGLRERLCAWELRRWCWKLREWAFGRIEGWEGKECGEEELDAVACVSL